MDDTQLVFGFYHDKPKTLTELTDDLILHLAIFSKRDVTGVKREPMLSEWLAKMNPFFEASGQRAIEVDDYIADVRINGCVLEVDIEYRDSREGGRMLALPYNLLQSKNPLQEAKIMGANLKLMQANNRLMEIQKQYQAAIDEVQELKGELYDLQTELKEPEDYDGESST